MTKWRDSLRSKWLSCSTNIRLETVRLYAIFWDSDVDNLCTKRPVKDTKANLFLMKRITSLQPNVLFIEPGKLEHIEIEIQNCANNCSCLSPSPPLKEMCIAREALVVSPFPLFFKSYTTYVLGLFVLFCSHVSLSLHVLAHPINANVNTFNR